MSDEDNGLLTRQYVDTASPEHEMQALADWDITPAPNRVGHVTLLGPPDTGTNLMMSSLLLNYPNRLPRTCVDGSFHTSDIGTNCPGNVWKHSISNASDMHSRILATSGRENLNSSALIIMIRSPIAQLISWHNAGYSLVPCTDRPYNQFDQPCFANTSPEHHDTTEGVDATRMYDESLQFKSTMDVYNSYLSQYWNIRSMDRFGHGVHVVRYEDLVYTPEVVLAQLARSFGWAQPLEFRTVDEPAKDHGNPVGREAALERLRTRSFLEVLSDEELSLLCAGVNETLPLLLESYEGFYTNTSRHYYQDCKSQRAPRSGA